MAFTDNAIVWEIRTAGNDTNGGGFKTGASGTDYSQQNSKNSGGNNGSTTDAVTNGTTTVTSATASFTAGIVGNTIYIAGGSGTLADRWFEVTAFTNSTTITVDRTIAASTGCTMNIGGALKTPGGLGRIVTVSNQNAGGMKAWVKNDGTHSLDTSLAANTPGGEFSITSLQNFAMIGYNASRGDNPTGTNRPTIQATGVPAVSFMLQFFADSRSFVANLILDANSKALGSAAIRIEGCLYNVKVTSVGGSSNGVTGGSTADTVAINCESINNGGNGFINVNCTDCVAKNNTLAGFNGNTLRYVNCIAIGNTLSGFQSAGTIDCFGCVSYGNTVAGFNLTGSTDPGRYINCIAENNGTYGFITGTTNRMWATMLLNCATYNNTSGATSLDAGVTVVGSITGSGSFFTNAAGGDFSLNSTAGAGALLIGTGYGTFPPVISTVSLPNVGAVQSNSSTPTASTHSFIG